MAPSKICYHCLCFDSPVPPLDRLCLYLGKISRKPAPSAPTTVDFFNTFSSLSSAFKNDHLNTICLAMAAFNIIRLLACDAQAGESARNLLSHDGASNTHSSAFGGKFCPLPRYF